MSLAQPSATKAATARAAAMCAEGRDVIVLSQGEPDFDTPKNVRAAAIRAIHEGRTRYTPVAGVAALREAICAKLLRDNGLLFSADQITVGCGAKQVIFNALLATLDPGDEVLIPSPCWVSYPEMVRIAGGSPRIVNCAQAPGFKLTGAMLAAAIGPRTKWLMLNSPCNPTGAVYGRTELLEIATVLRGNPDVWIMCDDIYEKLVYPPATFTTLAAAAPDLADRILVVNGLSKSVCMTGWRLGYGAGPEPLIKAMNTLQGQTTSHTSSISQYAAIEALSGPQHHIAALRDAFASRRDAIVAALSRVSGFECSVPDGAFYLFPSVRGLIGRRTPRGEVLKGDVDVADYLLDEAEVAVVPGSAFLAAGFLRISFASSEDELKRGCARIGEACQRLG
jgi:aspartate aminotransferase